MNDIVTTEDILKKMRSGYTMKHTIKYGEWDFAVRLLNGDEELDIIEKAKAESEKEKLKSDKQKLEIMKSLLTEAGSVDGKISSMPAMLLNKLSSAEVESLYSRYLEILHEVDIEFMEMDYDVIKDIIGDIRAKKQKPRQVSTRFLTMIGVFFLEEMLPGVSEPGS